MSPQWNRVLVGFLAVACVLAGLAIGLLHSWADLWCGSFIRAGVLLGAFFVAMPTQGRAAAWAKVSPTLILGVAAGLVLLGRVIQRPQVIIPLFSVLFVLMWVWPWLVGTGRRRP